MPICRDFYGSDGTRTRDLRRDRPNRAQRRSTTNVADRAHLQGFFAPRAPPLRMVEPIVQPGFGPRVGHGILSSWTTLRRRGRGVAGAVWHAEGRSLIRPPPYVRTRRQPVATHGNGIRLSEPFLHALLPRVVTDCDPGLHTRSILSCLPGVGSQDRETRAARAATHRSVECQTLRRLKTRYSRSPRRRSATFA
jgi:hypothetical protein